MKNRLWDLVPIMALGIFVMCIVLMVVNVSYMSKMNNTIETMWHEIVFFQYRFQPVRLLVKNYKQEILHLKVWGHQLYILVRMQDL